jgi:DNA-binding response OmpR family regulator
MEADAGTAFSVVAALDKFGMECRHAVDGNTGLTAFRSVNPHLVLIDAGLEGIDGWTMCGKIRQASTIPIIMLATELTEDIYLKSFRIGADECIVKPFAPKILMARVATHLRRVYRYDRAGEAAASTARESAKPKLPPGWGSADESASRGQQSKFEN